MDCESKYRQKVSLINLLNLVVRYIQNIQFLFLQSSTCQTAIITFYIEKTRNPSYIEYEK
jgi:hypothetical protein